MVDFRFSASARRKSSCLSDEARKVRRCAPSPACPVCSRVRPPPYHLSGLSGLPVRRSCAAVYCYCCCPFGLRLLDLTAISRLKWGGPAHGSDGRQTADSAEKPEKGRWGDVAWSTPYLDMEYGEKEYQLGSSRELDWLGHFAKKSTRLESIGILGAFGNCSGHSVDRFLNDLA
ncbi:hypothetical protein THAOC_06569, partial [Thalassiosira oceanica]